MEFVEQSAKVDNLFGALRYGDVFSFGGAKCDQRLTFGGPVYGGTIDRVSIPVVDRRVSLNPAQSAST